MLSKKAIQYYNNGYNCSQCLLRAAADVYGIAYTNEMNNMCSSINNGFGIKGICSVIVSAIMLFGILFDKETAKRLRIILIDEVYSIRKTINCGNPNGNSNCTNFIILVADITQGLIDKEKA